MITLWFRKTWFAGCHTLAPTPGIESYCEPWPILQPQPQPCTGVGFQLKCGLYLKCAWARRWWQEAPCPVWKTAGWWSVWTGTSSGSGRRGKTGHRTTAGKTGPAWGLGKRRKIFSVPANCGLGTCYPKLRKDKVREKRASLRGIHFLCPHPFRPRMAPNFLDL